MQTPTISAPRTPRLSRRLAAVLAAGALGVGVAVLTDGGSSSSSSQAAPSGAPAQLPLSEVDGALRHHHGIEVPKSVPQVSSYDRFHHFR